MQDLTGKVDATSGANGSLGAEQWNQLPQEVQNIIEDLGQTLSESDLNQLGKGISGYVASGDFYSDIGSQNTYVLSPIDGKQAPPTYADGMKIRFICNSTNTGNSTINVNGLGAVDIKSESGGDLLAGVLSETAINSASYNLANAEFRLKSRGAQVSIPDMPSLRLQEPVIQGQIYNLIGHTVSGVGGGQFYHDESDTTSVDDNGSVVVTPLGARIKRLNFNVVCPTMFGAIPRTNGGSYDNFDSTTAIQAAHDTGRHVRYSAGNYLITSAINLSRASSVSSESNSSAGRFRTSRDLNIVRIENDQVGGGIFQYVGDTSSSQTSAPKIEGLYLVADFPILYNDKTGDVSNGGPQPPMMKPHIKGCTIVARETGVGIGIDITKGFDGVITENEIANFDINMALTGCDINLVSDNRLINAESYHILEYSTESFGSQNEIRHNDILSIGDTGVMIKTNSRHARIFNNYLEQPQSKPDLLGFIDISSTDMPAIYGSNVAGVPQSVFIQDNRIDGMSSASDFVYRLNPTGVSHKIHDSGTTGDAVVNDAKGLVIEGDYLPVRYNSNAQHPFVNYDFFGEQFGRWNGFKNGASLANHGDLVVDVLSFSSLDKDAVNLNNSGDYISYDSSDIVVDAGHMGTVSQWYPPEIDGHENVNFASGETYTATFKARAESVSGDTLRIGTFLNGVSQGLVDMTLGQQYKTQSVSMSGASLTDEIGVAINRSTANGNIKIKSLTWTKN